MTIVVLVVLAGIWAAVLVPPMLRSRSEARPADSIGNFRRQLRVLQRTGPTVAAMGDTARFATPHRAAPALPAFAGIRGPVSPQATRRARTLRRRRDVLAGLLAGMVVTLALSAIPALRTLLWLHVALDVAFVAYVALLVRARNAAAEREMKLRFLPAPAHGDNVIMFRRSAN